MLQFKVVLFICVFITFASADSRPKVAFAPEVLQVIRATISKCISETGVDPKVIDLTEEGGYATDEAFKKYVHCVYFNSGFSNSNGLAKVKEGADLFPKEYSIVEKVMEDCNKLVENDPVETTYQFFKCFQDTSPVVMNICYQDGDKNKNVCK